MGAVGPLPPAGLPCQGVGAGWVKVESGGEGWVRAGHGGALVWDVELRGWGVVYNAGCI